MIDHKDSSSKNVSPQGIFFLVELEGPGYDTKTIKEMSMVYSKSWADDLNSIWKQENGKNEKLLDLLQCEMLALHQIMIFTSLK